MPGQKNLNKKKYETLRLVVCRAFVLGDIYRERESHRIMTTAPVTVVAHFCCEAHETKIFSFRLINNPLRST